MAEMNKFEYVFRTREVVGALTDFVDYWAKLSDACNTFGITNEEFEKKVILDIAIADFMKEVNERLMLAIKDYKNGDEDDG